ncbi:protoporphyrinogen oxidase [Natronoglycomyces albus]|nr:protoporphyrinogen oxidase [Natronoglycomyces albus]
MARVLVIGGGIAGLTAAHRLRQRLGPGAEIVLAEASDRLGGKIHSLPFAGLTVEAGAESLLAARPEPAALAEEVGLGEALRRPGEYPAALLLDGELKPFPAGTFMGLPRTIDDIASYLSTEGLAEAKRERPTSGPLLGPEEDRSIGDLVAQQLGIEVRDRLLEPILAGIYAGDLDRLSVAAVMPQLATHLRTHQRLTDAVCAMLPAPEPNQPKRPNPLATIEGGLGRLVRATAQHAKPDLRLRTTVRQLRGRPGGGWHAVCGPVPYPSLIAADAVVVAVPATPAAQLLEGHATTAVAALREVDYASVALATFAFPSGTTLPAHSGFLVPASSGHEIKAATFFTRKWPHLTTEDAPVIMRVSLGRYGAVRSLQRPDADLANLALREVRACLGSDGGTELPEPLKWRVNRWGGGLPQYTPGHSLRMSQARAELAQLGGIALAGAAADGVGIAACIASGRAAADSVADQVL